MASFPISRFKMELQKAQKLLALAKKLELQDEMENLQEKVQFLLEKVSQEETQLHEKQLEEVTRQFTELEQDFAEFFQRVTLPLQSLSAFLKEIEMHDYHFEEFFDYSQWKKRFDTSLQLAEHITLTDNMQAIKDNLHFMTLQLEDMNQQMEDIGKELETATAQVKKLLQTYRKIPLERLKQELHLADEDLENLLKMLITLGKEYGDQGSTTSICAHIEGAYLYRE